MEDVYIVDAVRTAIGKFGGSLTRFTAAELGSIVIKKIVERNKIDPISLDIVIMGHVIRDGAGQDTARQASILAGIPPKVDAFNVDMVCASGMMAIISGASMIRSKDADLVIAGGMENMSRAPFIIPYNYRWGIRIDYIKENQIIDSLIYEGLRDPFNGKVMVQEADMIAIEMNYKRERLEEIAYESHMRAFKASKNGSFKKEIVPVKVDDEIALEVDEGIRPDTSLEKMASLPTIFPGGVHTAATSSQISDGASVVLLASEDAIANYNLKKRAKIVGYTWVGVESWRFTEAPIHAVRRLLSKTGYNLEDVDLFENNEAFAVSTALFEDLLNVPRDRLNVFGGAIALGHPLGASGARILTTLLNAMENLNYKRGVAALCHGTGGATAIMVERT
ncbi:MAG: thiolase family protein [Aigarchaeota archaeon]|nr:thiolase family protein [Aigarchaeota archaeon]MCX8193048.1 thiolase family protein [Nitrososphaeria archaeon]MDW7986214.1 thiolase family protein [Nitrososphaerota archaeon]